MTEPTESIKDRMDKIATINFSITKCPQKVYEDFTAFCKGETNDNYSMGLKLLLDQVKVNYKDLVIMRNIEELKSDVEDIKIRLEAEPEPKEPSVEVEKPPKTFGSNK